MDQVGIARHDELFFKTESLAQPLNCRGRVAVTQAQDDSGFGVFWD